MASNNKAVKLGNGMKERWTGPFKVVSLSRKGVATVVDSAGHSRRHQKVNVRHLKLYFRRQGVASKSLISKEVTVQDDVPLEASVAVEAGIGKRGYLFRTAHQ